jgi:hypothetical protein
MRPIRLLSTMQKRLVLNLCALGQDCAYIIRFLTKTVDYLVTVEFKIAFDSVTSQF